MKAAYLTLGCKVNQYDTDAMRELMEAAGYESVSFHEQADVYLINTCTVTNTADKKSRQMIRRAAEHGGVVLVTGCLAQRSAEEILAIPGVSAVFGVNERRKVVEIAERAKKTQVTDILDIAKEKNFEPLFITKSEERTRAHVKICDGCNNFCSYCIIPYTRGRVRSRSMEEIVREVQALAQNDVKEIVLTGIHLSSYGKDTGSALIDVIEETAKIEGISRIRLGSLEPTLLTEQFLQRAEQIEKLCPHFHVALQSGSEAVLFRMNRAYTKEAYREHISALRAHFENPAVTTDVIAGFSGETEEEHQESLAFIKEIGFAKVHVFPYSEREGTRAADFQNQVPISERKRRTNEIIAAAEEDRKAYLSAFLNRQETVLFEEEKDGVSYGYTARYVKVMAKARQNTLKRVMITGVAGDTLVADVLD